MTAVHDAGPDALVIAAVALAYEHDVVLARQYARLIAGELGFDAQDQVRFATAVSELARNAYQYAHHGRVTFALGRESDRGVLTAQVRDDGPGIPDLECILGGRYVSSTGMGIGITGARRLSDRFAIESAPGMGTTVTVGKIVGHAGPGASAEAASRVADALQRRDTASPFEELQRQNQELAVALDALTASNADVDRLNVELEETNRGVLALYAELDDRATELRRLSESKSRFLSDVSHELRTPLSSIINLARILLDRIDGQLTPEQERQITLVQRSAENLTEMVSDLLDIAKIEAGKVDLRPDGFTVEELFAALRGMFRPLATSEQVALVFEDAAPPITLHTDEQRIAQVLRNFISNALKFTTSGEVRIAACQQGEMVRFIVADTGIGISPADQQRVFEEFAQVDGPIQRRVRGTGLGLPLARKLAILLGGGVEVESELGVGSRFSLIVPRDIRSMGATSA